MKPVIKFYAVVFKDSTTTKLRTVNNASQKTSNGLSLNKQLAMGKIEQPTIFSLLLRWRKFKIAIVADIQQIYKQIKMHDDHQKYQMVLWRNGNGERIKSYALTTVTFGVANSPCIAIRTLKELALQVKEKLPLASTEILNNFYMDDYSGGVIDTVHDAVENTNN